MKVYEIVFERTNGSIGIAQIYAKSVFSAIEEFERLFRYRDGKFLRIDKAA